MPKGGLLLVTAGWSFGGHWDLVIGHSDLPPATRPPQARRWVRQRFLRHHDIIIPQQRPLGLLQLGDGGVVEGDGGGLLGGGAGEPLLGVELQLHEFRRQRLVRLDALLDAKQRVLGGTRPLPELFAAAGIAFDFSEKTLRPLMNAVGEELARLPS